LSKNEVRLGWTIGTLVVGSRGRFDKRVETDYGYGIAIRQLQVSRFLKAWNRRFGNQTMRALYLRFEAPADLYRNRYRAAYRPANGYLLPLPMDHIKPRQAHHES
jgi:hypothetical protein